MTSKKRKWNKKEKTKLINNFYKITYHNLTSQLLNRQEPNNNNRMEIKTYQNNHKIRMSNNKIKNHKMKKNKKKYRIKAN